MEEASLRSCKGSKDIGMGSDADYFVSFALKIQSSTFSSFWYWFKRDHLNLAT